MIRSYHSLLTTVTLAALLGCAGPAVAAVRYEITDLGLGQFPYGINEQGEVVGGEGQGTFLWDDGVLTDLGVSGWAYDLNDSAQIVGIQTGGWNQAFLWDSGNVTLLGTFGGPVSQAYGINDVGQVVGDAELPDRTKRAFLYDNGGLTDLGDFGGEQSWAFGINDAGQVVGTAETDVTPPGHLPIRRAFVFENGVMTSIVGDGSEAWDVNEYAQVVGHYRLGGFLWEDNVLTNLGELHWPRAINNQAQVVGTSGFGGYNAAYIWEDGVATSLSELIPGDSGWVSLDFATDISDSGQIVGWGEVDTAPSVHGFLLTPVPEPASISILTLGAIFAKRRRTAQ